MTMVAFFLLALSLVPIAKSELLGKFCNTFVYEEFANSTYLDNSLKLLSATLTKNASSSPFLFAKGSVGSGEGTLYGLALCRGDTTNAAACSDCLDSAFGRAQQLCRNDTDVALFDDMCLIRFSDEDFIDSTYYDQITYGVGVISNMDTSNTSVPLLPGWDPGSAASAARIADIIRVLLQETTQAAAEYLNRRYVTGFMDATNTMPPLYSMAQCTPDLVGIECTACLQYIMNMVMTNFTGQQSGRVLAVGCSLWYNTTLFYSGTPIWRIISPTEVVEQPAAAVLNLKHKSN